MKEKEASKHLALEYFDFFYGAAFGAKWNKMRLAMLTGSKHAALINNFSNINETRKRLENQASMNMFDFAFKYELATMSKRNSEGNKKKLQHLDMLKIPPALKVYAFENGDTSKFDPPKAEVSKLLGRFAYIVYSFHIQ